jgi:molecular chaperone GrpE
VTRPPVEGDTAEHEASPDAAVDGSPDLEREIEELREAHARAVADYQNFRRRSEQQWEERARATLAGAVRGFLPVLDDLDRAVAALDAEHAGAPWVEGLRMVQHKFRESLAAAGVRELSGKGASFDPAVHEAISFAPGPEGQVVHLVTAGYAIDDYVIRAAQVVVGNGSEPDVAAPGSD